jgi:hypothetical protein
LKMDDKVDEMLKDSVVRSTISSGTYSFAKNDNQIKTDLHAEGLLIGKVDYNIVSINDSEMKLQIVDNTDTLLFTRVKK